jgi:hypothetical protein
MHIMSGSCGDKQDRTPVVPVFCLYLGQVTPWQVLVTNMHDKLLHRQLMFIHPYAGPCCWWSAFSFGLEADIIQC